MTDDDKRRFANAANGLYKIFNKEADPGVTKVLFAALKHLDIAGAEYCISQAILKEPRFPIPQALAKYQHDIPRKSAPKIEHKAEYNTPLADQAMQMINDMLEGKTSNADYVAKMKSMDHKFPGIGWREQAEKFENYLAQN